MDLLLNTGEDASSDLMSRLFGEFQSYLSHGGFLTAINDIAYINENRFWPVEIKWARQIRSKQLKQIAKYSNGKILTKLAIKGEMHGVPTEPLPLALLRLDA